jgi:hypothetical protein
MSLTSGKHATELLLLELFLKPRVFLKHTKARMLDHYDQAYAGLIFDVGA